VDAANGAKSSCAPMARDDCGETMTPSTPRAQDRVEPAGREAVAAEEELLRAIAVPLRALPDVVERDVLVGAAVQLVVRDVVADHNRSRPARAGLLRCARWSSAVRSADSADSRPSSRRP